MWRLLSNLVLSGKKKGKKMDKIQKIKKEVERIQLYSQSETLKQVLDYIDKVQEESVNDDLEEAAKNHAAERYRVTRDRELAEKCKWSFKAGAKWQKEHLWKPADGDDLPDTNKEVIVLTQKYPLKGSEYAVSFAHRPYKGKYIGKSLTTGNIETFENKTYYKGGWNQPDVKYWLDCEWPNKEE